MTLTHRSTSPWRSLRALVVAGIAAGTLAACTDSTSPAPKPPGSLTITVSGLPTAVPTVDLAITGPGGYASNQTVGSTPVSLMDLAPGTYTITAATFTDAGTVYAPVPAPLAVPVTSDAASDANVFFSSLVTVASMRPEDITPDGSTVLATDQNSSAADFWLFNTTTNTNAFGASPGDVLADFANGISSGHRVSALYQVPVKAGLWTAGGGWVTLGSVFAQGCLVDSATSSYDEGGAWDISADGQTSVGLLWDGCRARGFRWTEAGGMDSLHLLGAPYPGDSFPPNNRATKVSDDGSTAGGFAQTAIVDRWPAIWHADGTGFLLPGSGNLTDFPTDDSPGEVLSISADGSMVAGIWALEGFYWTQADGVVNLGARPPFAGAGDPVFPNAIAAGGQLIFGQIGDPFGFGLPIAFVYTKAAGMRSLQDVLVDAGVQLPTDFWITGVKAASTDGTVLTGMGYDASFSLVMFVLKAPVSIYGL